MTEYFWVVDEEDRVIGKETRENCHKNRLIHRSVYVLLINSKGELFLQKRSMSKDLYPGYYTGSATGHVDYGETYDQAAQRELREELGINAPLEKIGKFHSFSPIENEFSTLYVCSYDGEVKFNPEEITMGLWMKLEQVREDMESGKKLFAPGFKVAFNEYEQSKLEHVVNKKDKSILFVCTGNSFRSPVAEALFKKMVGGTNVDSAGTQPALFIAQSAKRLLEDESALEYLKGSPEGIDEKKLEKYDVIVAMEDVHRQELLKRNPTLKNKIVVWDVKDPIYLPPGHGKKVLENMKRKVLELAKSINTIR